MNEYLRITKYLAEKYPHTFIHEMYSQNNTVTLILEADKITPNIITEMRINRGYNLIEITPKDKETIYIKFTRNQ